MHLDFRGESKLFGPSSGGRQGGAFPTTGSKVALPETDRPNRTVLVHFPITPFSRDYRKQRAPETVAADAARQNRRYDAHGENQKATPRFDLDGRKLGSERRRRHCLSRLPPASSGKDPYDV